jgi:hypothetical protein
LNQEDLNHLNKSVRSNEIEAAIKILPENKSSMLGRFTAKFYQTFKEELTPMFSKLFRKIEREGILPNSFYKASTTLIPTRNKNTTTTKL